MTSICWVASLGQKNESGINLSTSGEKSSALIYLFIYCGRIWPRDERATGNHLPQWCSVNSEGLQPVRQFVGKPTKPHPWKTKVFRWSTGTWNWSLTREAALTFLFFPDLAIQNSKKIQQWRCWAQFQPLLLPINQIYARAEWLVQGFGS